jgi:hypothetical protein
MNNYPHDKHPPDQYPHDKLDRILVQGEALAPSSGFAASVMDAIQEETIAPAPIPFPWKLAVPGIAAFLAAIVIAIRFTVSAAHNLGAGADGADFLSGPQLDLVLSQILRSQAGLVLLALAAALLCTVLCQRLAGGWSTR